MKHEVFPTLAAHLRAVASEIVGGTFTVSVAASEILADLETEQRKELGPAFDPTTPRMREINLAFAEALCRAKRDAVNVLD